MGWMHERDLLVAEALALVKQVKGAQSKATVPPTENLPIEIKMPGQPSEFEPLKFEQMASVPHRNEREEIANRLASFKATQLRFQREREQYGSATLSDALNAVGAQGVRPSRNIET